VTIKKKYHDPLPETITILTDLLKDKTKILEVGPGEKNKFALATHSCGAETCDFSADLLPYKDKEFDFIYCRHVVEDLYNPFLLMQEMTRVGKAGYVEAPSPLVEMTRGIDGNEEVTSSPWRGHHHHRYFVWNDGEVLNFLTKYVVVEYARTEDGKMKKFLEDYPGAWNTYYLWNDKIKYKHFQHHLDASITEGKYGDLIKKGIEQGINNSYQFFKDREELLTNES
jgi:hypothetical protein